MNKDTVDGNWGQFKGMLQKQWGKLTRDDLGVIADKPKQLQGKLKERHSIVHEEAEKQAVAGHAKNPTNFFERY